MSPKPNASVRTRADRRKHHDHRQDAARARQRLADHWAREHEADAGDAGGDVGTYESALAEQPTVQPSLARVGLPVVLAALRTSDDEDALAFVALLDSLSAPERARVSWDEVACASGIGSKRLLEVAQSSLHAVNTALSDMLLSHAMPAIVARSIKSARTAKGIDDRIALLKAKAIVPIPKGSQTAIQIINPTPAALPAAAAEESAWDQERQLRQLHEVLGGGRKHLPAASVTHDAALPPALDAMQRETLSVLDAEAGAEDEDFGV